MDMSEAIDKLYSILYADDTSLMVIRYIQNQNPHFLTVKSLYVNNLSKWISSNVDELTRSRDVVM